MNADVEKALQHARPWIFAADYQVLEKALRDQAAEIVVLYNTLREMILVHVVDDDAWDQAAETEQRMQRAIGAARSRIADHLGATHDHP